MAPTRKIVIVGASSAIAEQCARLWLQERAADLTLVGRDADKIERIAADLRVRSPRSTIAVVQTPLLEASSIRSVVDAIAVRGAIDVALIAHGSLPDQGACTSDLTAARDALLVNGVSPVLFAEAFAGAMQKAGHGKIALIGSVAGDRGRKSNYVYGAAKGLVARYAQGLQHRLAETGVKVILVKPGPTDTPMTAHLKAYGAKLADAHDVARAIVRAVESGQAVVYAPAKWGMIMQVIRHLPRFIFNRMDI
jgi:decaprenylphospho-beta-D-erythro-pentofuranosid-2-ulose 2-reductase